MKTLSTTLAILVISGLRLTQSYKFSVFESEHLDLCNNQTCDSRPHTACGDIDVIDPSCRNFERIPMTKKDIREIILGHNGLRNRVAMDYYRPATNMNYLHWDKDLAKVAELWMGRCSLGHDECKSLHDRYMTMGQNIHYIKDHPKTQWPIQVIRNWFLEGHGFDPKYINSLPNGKGINYTQLIWANTEFVGCAAARMFEGYLMVCYYHPAGNMVDHPIYKIGRPCSDCPLERPTCSKVFKGLCGIDTPLNDSRSILSYASAILISCFTVAVVLIR